MNSISKDSKAECYKKNNTVVLVLSFYLQSFLRIREQRIVDLIEYGFFKRGEDVSYCLSLFFVVNCNSKHDCTGNRRFRRHYLVIGPHHYPTTTRNI